MESCRYQLWARFPGMNQPDRWHAQSSGTLAEILAILPGWCRTYPDHEVAVTPVDSLPLRGADYVEMRYCQPYNPSQAMNTLSEYWQSHGYSKEQADAIEREQIAQQLADREEQDLYDAGLYNLEG